MGDPTDSVVLTDPQRTEGVGRALAGQLAHLEPAIVVSWDTSEDAVLAHVVARELGVGLRLAVDSEGIVSLPEPLPRDVRAVLVAESFQPRTGLSGLAGVVHHSSGTVVGVGVASGSAVLDDTEAAGALLVRPENA